MNIRRFLSLHWLFLSILLAAFVVRLYRISNEPLDWHAWRQADTASVTREYVKHGIDLLSPQYHDVSNIPSGKDNLKGYRMVEFPMINALDAAIIRATGWPLALVSRLTSVFFSLGTLASLFYLVKSLSGKKVAYLTAILFAFLPYSVYYSRVILPEPSMLFFATFSLAAFHFWLQQKSWSWYLLSFVSLTLGFLMKPSVIFFLPAYAGLILYKELPVKAWTAKFIREKVIYYGLTLVPGFGLSVVPLLVWRNWIAQFPEGIPAFEWLLNSNGIRFRPAWFRWLFWERLTKLMTGFVGVLFMPLNVMAISKDLWVYGAWGLGIFAYLAVIATGNVQHDYYQTLTVPIVCILIGRGLAIAHRWLTKKVHVVAASAGVALAIGASLFLSWQQVGGYFNINHTEYLETGAAVDRLTPPDALVIAPAFGDTQFLYATNRRGWPIGFDIEDKIKKGADYYVSTSYDDEAKQLEQTYTVVEKNKTFILIDLQKKK